MLEKDCSRHLTTMQVYSDVASVVKELIENSVDAGAGSIDIMLDNFGLGKITVSDDGCGIAVDDAPLLAKQGCTSKIGSFQDLVCFQQV